MGEEGRRGRGGGGKRVEGVWLERSGLRKKNVSINSKWAWECAMWESSITEKVAYAHIWILSLGKKFLKEKEEVGGGDGMEGKYIRILLSRLRGYGGGAHRSVGKRKSKGGEVPRGEKEDSVWSRSRGLPRFLRGRIPVGYQGSPFRRGLPPTGAPRGSHRGRGILFPVGVPLSSSKQSYSGRSPFGPLEQGRGSGLEGGG